MDQTNNILIKNIKADKKISIAIMSSFAVLTIQYLILYYFNLPGSNLGNMIQLASKIIVGFLFILGLPAILQRNWILFVGVYFFSIGIFLYNYLVFSQNSEFLKDIIFPFFFTSLPCFLYSYSIKDRRIFENTMGKIANIVFTLGTLIAILVVLNKISLGRYSMSLSYYMLLPTIIYLKVFFENFSLKYFISFTISLLVILALGARGPIMCIGIFVIMYLLNNRTKLTYKIIIVYSSILASLMLIFVNINKLLLFMYNFMESFGISSRTLRLFMKGDISSSGRDYLYKEIIYQIKENPIMGIGVTGDRLYIGTYTHNVFIEILSGFGVVFGSLIIILLILVSFKSIKQSDRNDSNFMVIWFSIGLAPLIVSGSYLIDFNFWIFFGFALNSIFKKQ